MSNETIRKNQKKIKKPIFPQKNVQIVIILNDGMLVHGKGHVDGVKNLAGDLIFTGTVIYKNDDKPKRRVQKGVSKPR